MGVSSGIFNIIQRGQLRLTATEAMRATATQGNKQPSEGSTNPLTWSLKKNESAVAAYWRLAPDSAARNAPRQDVVKRLEKMADDDNKDIAAEKMRQAKSKLEGLRRQLQMLAATGDVKQLRRIAAEAASLAREIGAAARSMAQGVGAGSASSDAAPAQATASAANAAVQAASSEGNTESAPPAAGTASSVTGAVADGSDREQSFKALHALTSEARSAVVQAKGIIAQAAQMARSRRKSADGDEDRYFRQLQEVADDALAEIDAGQREALNMLLNPQSDGALGELTTAISSSTLTISLSVEAMVTTDTHIEIVT
ncbi:hypothetical protein [Dongia rigui]|uniref:Talin n=1 Tax=Dongia rigui TaxID=940149 RepID=A0ABU5E1P2_9PROT|nr:hypothetical protein [Dongia rigui]MDY0873465.1 hypothetical protein [Dongia rigui]